MIRTLRDLLLQRAARLQERPALSAPGWGTLGYARFRNRIEGIAFGLLAEEGSPDAWHSATGTAWDWASELAAAVSGLCWGPDGSPVPADVLGGAGFHAEAGRERYHSRERVLSEETPFQRGMSHGELLRRLTRLNEQLGWDHETELPLPLARLGDPPQRAALWSLLYAGGHAVLLDRVGADWDPAPFGTFWE